VALFSAGQAADHVLDVASLIMPGRANQVLLVGEATARLEVDLVPYGLICHAVADAKEAVEELKQALGIHQPWSSVVVAAGLPDMSGPAFVDGLMKHFDPATVVLIADVEPSMAQHLSQSSKISIFPGGTDGVVVADHLFKRMGGAPAPTLPPPPTPSLGTPSSGLASLFDPPRTGAGAGAPPGLQQTPNQAFSMPPPSASWQQPPPPSQQRPTTMPFFAALSQQPSQPSQPPVSQPPQSSPSSPPQPSGTERATLARIEAMAEELDNARAEIITIRARLQAAETRANTATEQAYHHQAQAEAMAADMREAQTELEMIRSAAASDVAEINPIADEGAALRAELENLNLELHGAITDRDGAVGQLELVRGERDQLTTTLEALRAELAAAQRAVSDATADVEQQRAATESIEAQLQQAQGAAAELQALQALMAEKDLALEEARAAAAAARGDVAERDQKMSELQSQLQAQGEKILTLTAELAGRGAELAAAAGLKDEIAALHAAKRESEEAWAAEQKNVAELEHRLAELEASLADAASTVLDLESKLSTVTARAEQATAAELRVAELELVAAEIEDLREQLAEAERYGKLEEARADRAVSDAAGMRQMIEAQTHEQARIVGEIEQLRPIATEVERARAAMVDMQRQLEAAFGTDDADGSTEGAIEEGVRARTRELLELARAIEPFTWGLDQAAVFFADVGKEGAQRHVQAMRLLQKTLERLKNELDRLHQSH